MIKLLNKMIKEKYLAKILNRKKIDKESLKRKKLSDLEPVV